MASHTIPRIFVLFYTEAKDGALLTCFSVHSEICLCEKLPSDKVLAWKIMASLFSSMLKDKMEEMDYVTGVLTE